MAPANRQRTHANYRPDIDGLRAVAVLSVLAGHAYPALAPGGFVGVDIFFVISGFLISGIILGELASARFTFFNFYSRRIRRIFPALAVVLAFCLGFGWIALLPFDFRALGAHIGAGAGFLSNILLWGESGNYFDADAKLKPLLHLWSLGVEEQYYLAWPLLLFLVRRSVKLILATILIVAVVSFTMNIYLVSRAPSAAFYLPHTRTWELMIGSFIAFARLHGPAVWPSAFRGPIRDDGRRSDLLSNVLSLIGAALIGAALLLLNEQRPFPGWWALLPTTGAALLIAAGPRAVVNRLALANSVLVFIGLISYPLYLWHWPLLTFARILSDGEPTAAIRSAALASSFVLAWLTYRFLETKIRHARPTGSPDAPVYGLAACVAILGLTGVLAFRGVVESRASSVPGLDSISAAVHDWHNLGDRVIAGNSAEAVFFFGDSHMQQYLPRIAKTAMERRAPVRTVIFRTQGGCAPIPGIERLGRNCRSFIDKSLDRALQSDVKVIVIAASWMGFTNRTDYVADGSDRPLNLEDSATQDRVFANFEHAVSKMIGRQKRVVLVLSSPRGKEFDPRTMATRVGLGFEINRRDATPRSVVAAGSAVIDDRLRSIARRLGADLVDPLDFMCSASTCPATDADGNPLYMDISHIRESVVLKKMTAFDQYIYVDPP